jgi:predicted acylesterase/phospholipase RssA
MDAERDDLVSAGALAEYFFTLQMDSDEIHLLARYVTEERYENDTKSDPESMKKLEDAINHLIKLIGEYELVDEEIMIERLRKVFHKKIG